MIDDITSPPVNGLYFLFTHPGKISFYYFFFLKYQKETMFAHITEIKSTISAR